MNSVLHGELLKLRTVRLPLLGLAGVTVAGALSAIALITTAGHGDSPPLDHGSLGEIVHGPFAIVAGAALLAGIVGTAGEFRHQTITSTLLVQPRRARLVTAKALAYTAYGALLAVVAGLVNLAIAVPWLATKDVPLTRPADVAAVMVGSSIAAALFAIAGVGLGALVANQTAAVTISLVWLLAIEGVIVTVTSNATVHDWLPGGAGGVIARGGIGPHDGLSFLAATGCAMAYAGGLMAAGIRRLVNRDIT